MIVVTVLASSCFQALAGTRLPVAQPAPGSVYPEIPAAAVSRCQPFPVRGYHQHIFPERQPMAVFHERLEQLAELDYNLVVFGLGHSGAATITMYRDGTIAPNGCDTGALRALVAHAIDLGLEPVFEMKFIGKQLPLIRPLLEEHPGLVIDPENRSTVLNAAYRMPDGRDAYTATALRLIEYLLDLYPEQHAPKYFHLGIDEFDADDMATLAQTLGMTPPQAFAHCLNLGTDALLARGVTPIIWGDILLSAVLGGDEHGITLSAYRTPDPRHLVEPGRAYHGAYKSGKVSLHTMVNHLRDRDKVIVADWHYSPSSIGEFPSVDYFLGLGFKDVWGCPWFDATNMRQFSRYAASRGCGGMIATAWNVAYLPDERLRFLHILRNSAAYFLRPGLAPPAEVFPAYEMRGREGLSVADEKRTGMVARDDLTLTFQARVADGITPRDAVLLFMPPGRGAQAIESPLTFDPATRQLRARLSLPPDVATDRVWRLGYGYTDSVSGYFVHADCPQGFVVTHVPVQLPEVRAGTLLSGVFTDLADPGLKTTQWLAGECATILGSARSRKPGSGPRSEALDVECFDRLWAYPSTALNQKLAQGFRIEIEAKMTGRFSGNDYCALLTKGSFHTGFRVLVRKDGVLLLQFAGLAEGNPLWVHTKAPLPMDAWLDIVLTYRPPDEGEPGEAVICIGGVEQARQAITVAMPASSAVIGVGCEFTDPRAGPTGKRRPNFPGLVRRLRMSTL